MRLTKENTKRPHLAKVASLAGVSLATADRVINRRKGVKDRTRIRVLDAARDIGYLSAEEASRYRPAACWYEPLSASIGRTS